MLATYPGAADPPSYVKSLAGRLMVEPRAIAIACCDPKHGLAKEIFVKPTVADIARWCERECEAIAQMVRDDDARIKREDEEARERERRPPEMDRSNRETIDELRARLGPTFGLKPVPKGGIGSRADDELSEEEAKQRQREQTQRAVEASSRAILREYASRGIEPVFTNGGLPVSPALVNSLVERGLIGRDVLGARGPMAKARKERKRASR